MYLKKVELEDACRSIIRPSKLKNSYINRCEITKLNCIILRLTSVIFRVDRNETRRLYKCTQNMLRREDYTSVHRTYVEEKTIQVYTEHT